MPEALFCGSLILGALIVFAGGCFEESGFVMQAQTVFEVLI